jgi:hypothetical protein
MCDDGNPTSGDGCSNVCVIEPGYLCMGGEDLISADTCYLGQLPFFDGFESGQSSGWTVNTGLKGSWTVAPLYKNGGQFGARLSNDARMFEGENS